ncbi:hypothetical protein [Psychroserpens luteolus]|uniref:hypothetical protein n=1 Tax=Psychroserpens luteolus TaxID=2855840 RepID=UPI001E37DF8C|nr:hypothetical protein [Psychroserpens luteolus]MCD2259515.1 hypothetical protein [Psychroserpens luteolus]
MIKQKKITVQKTLFQEALLLARTPIIIALFLTPIRYTLELIGIHENYIFIIGLLWLTIGVSIYWSIKFHDKKRFLLLLLLSLTVYSPISRFPVAVAWWIDTKWELGTHYGLYFDNFGQVALNQLIYGSLIQIIPGFLVGSITFAIMRQKQALKLKNNTIKNG